MSGALPPRPPDLGRLRVGARLATYEIIAPLGVGGMGEVFRARDTNLGREVATKVLPAAFASDPDRLARFERVARLLAALKDPGIAHVYGFECATLRAGSAAHFLAMELVPGEDLTERLTHGAVPVDEAIAIARQVAAALEEAHEKGIVHRDLKPGNVKVTFDVFTGSLRDTTRTHVGSMESAPVYAEPGWLLFAGQGVLAAQPFDAGRRQLAGEAVSLDDEPTSIFDPAFSFTAAHSASVSSAGSLAYFSAPSIETTPTWLDGGGKVTGTLNVPTARYSTVRISPDGSRAALVRSTSPTESSLWLADLARGGATRLSSGSGPNESPVWSPDGTRVVFASDRDCAQDLFVKAVGDASPEQPLYRSSLAFKSPDGWSPDGRWILFQQLDPDTQQNVWLLPTTGTPSPAPYVRTPARDRGGWPSPDGRWAAYLSEDSGRMELYVKSFPVPAHKVQVSTEGTVAAWWTRDGGQILFLDTDRQRLWRVDVEPGATPQLGAPKAAATLPGSVIGLDAMSDRQRWLALVPEREGIGSVTIVQSWRAALAGKRRAEP